MAGFALSTEDHQYSHLLTAVGRTAESLAASEHALDLDPLALPMKAHLGFHYHYARQPEKAIAQLQKTIAMDNNYPLARFYIGLAYEQKGLLVDAIDSFQKAIVLSRETAPYLSGLGHALALAGKVTDARRIVDELAQLSKSRYVSAFDNAVIYAGLGDKDQAFLWLEKAGDEHSSWVMYLRVEPRLDPLRSDPRFDALLRRLQLPEL